MPDFAFPFREYYENGSQYAYRALRGAIMQLRLAPGAVLNDADLAKQLSVSRTPIREAMFRLRGENLVSVMPQRGSSVTLIDLTLVEESFFMRSTLEPQVLLRLKKNFSLAAEMHLRQNLECQRLVLEHDENLDEFFRLDQAFHREIYDGAGLSTVWESIERASTHYDRLRYMDILLGTYHLKHIYEQHLNLFELLRSPNASADFGAFCLQHLSGYKESMPKYLEHYGNFFM